MKTVKLNINGRSLTGYIGQTIYEIAAKSGIDIPTLCNDERMKPNGACGICVVEVEGISRLMRSCSTPVANEMVIHTESERVITARKMILELLLSDHTGDCRPPCSEACPAKTDCQGYVGLIANGELEEALKLIKDKIPLPASIGRICPHPCEDACRRKLVEEPINIASLKYVPADYDLHSKKPFVPKIKEETGKNVAIIGGGPAGLSAAYFLRQRGHTVTVYDAMEKMGGMLRYGIPEYRLPKSVLDAEIKTIEAISVKLVNNIHIGKDITLSELRSQNNAVLIAVGAWESIPLGCLGEELDGVIGGIDFLRKAAKNENTDIGKNVAIVGGGNTAMDACRTAVRLGAKNVYNIYRRTKNEMPAKPIEIDEAEEEGVVFKYLTNPTEIIGNENGRVAKIRLQKMQRGEPDESGRRSSVPIEGAEEVIELDSVIIAIGQRFNNAGLEEIELTKQGTISADENTFRTNIDGVFAIGDATNKGAGIAIEAIAEAKNAAIAVDGYLNGHTTPYTAPFLVKQELTEEDLKDTEKCSRQKMKHLSPSERKTNFDEVNLGYTIEQAKLEASRCLECGCQDYFECRLINYANRYDVNPQKYDGEKHDYDLDLSNPFILRNPEKCILCGLCVRVCGEVMGVHAYGTVNRGFNAAIVPELRHPLSETGCISCGQCAALCPTGAIFETTGAEKSVPVSEDTTHSTCSYCGIGCPIKITSKGGSVLRTLPDNDVDKSALLCGKGRFGLIDIKNHARITEPLILNVKSGKLEPASYADALTSINAKLNSIIEKHGATSVCVSISDSITNEEIFAIKEYAENVLKTDNIASFSLADSGLEPVFGEGSSPNTLSELGNTDVILLICDDITKTHTIAGIKIKQAVQNGARLIVISKDSVQADDWADISIRTNDDLSVLKQMAKHLIDTNKKPIKADGFDALSEYLKNTRISENVKSVAELYKNADRSLIVFDESALSKDSATLLADIAVLGEHIGQKGDGIIALKRNNNSQGLLDMGIKKSGEYIHGEIENGNIKALLVFGENLPAINTEKLDFLMVSDCVMTETAKRTDVALPAPLPACINGTYTATDRNVQNVKAATIDPFGIDTLEVVKNLAKLKGYDMPYADYRDVLKRISERVKKYDGISDLIYKCKYFSHTVADAPLYSEGFATESGSAKLSVPKDEKLYSQDENTNERYNLISEKISAGK